MKGVKSLHCLDINNATELLELHYDDLDFELGPAPYYCLKLKYPINSVHTNFNLIMTNFVLISY
jgi:hypothetical protein